MSDAEIPQSPFDETPRFSLRVLMISVACFAIVCAAIRWATSGDGERRCSSNLRNIGLALAAYHASFGHFPPAHVTDTQGKRLLSWRLTILPYLDSDMSLYSSFNLNEPWDGPNNAARSRTLLTNYHCPSSSQQAPLTDYVAVIGPNTAWPGAKGNKLTDFKDPSKTILVVEVANSGIHWAEPRDLSIEKVAKGILSNHVGGFNAVFADGHVEFISDDIDPKKLAEMLEINPQSGASD